jgi:aminoglycoside phosphotransferase (APT) family kinase protein
MTSSDDYSVVVARALTSLQRNLVVDFIQDLRSSRNRHAAAGMARLIARINTGVGEAERIAERHLPRWRALGVEASGVTHSATAGGLRSSDELFMKARQLGEAIRGTFNVSASSGGSVARNFATELWFREAIDAAKDYFDEYETAVPQVSGASEPTPSRAHALRATLGRYLHQRYPQLCDDPILSLDILPAGGSKETAIFRIGENAVLPTHLVLRLDKINTPTGTSAFGEFHLLRALESAGLPVPTALLAESDTSVLGGAFVIVSEIRDSIQVGYLFPELNAMSELDGSFGPDLARSLARLHQLDGNALGLGMGGHHAAADPIEMVVNFQTMWRGLAHKPPMSVATDLGFAWLLSRPLPPDRPRQLVHGDVGMHNMLMRGGRLTAILDWELAHIGDPAEDIGYIRAPILTHVMPWEDFVSHYLGAGGDSRACDMDAVDWYSVWAHTRNSVYTAYLFDVAARGERSDTSVFVSGLDFFPRTQHYILRELAVANRKRK